MKASEVVMILRAFLKDEDCQNYVFSDGILLDYIHKAQNAIISEFRLNIHTISQTINTQEDIILPSQIAYIYSLTLNGRGLKYAQPSSALNDDEPCFYHKRANIYAISGTKTNTSANLNIVASFFAHISEIDDELCLSFEYFQTIALSAFCDLLLIENNVNNPQRLLFYKERLQDEKNALRAFRNKAMNKSATFSKASL